MHFQRISIAAVMVMGSACFGQSVWRVNDGAVSGGDGSSWGSAFDNLQSALGAASSSDEIWIAQGIYTPSDTDATISFVMIDTVSLYGGFAGDEISRNQRDPDANQTILLGDIGRDDTLNPYMINSSSSGHVIVASGVSQSTVLDGLTIEHGAYGPPGTPAGNPLMFGSGIYSIGGSPTINNCVIRMNYSRFAAGGGAYFLDSIPIITNSLFELNYGHLSNGGAIYLAGTSEALIEDSEFRYNTMVFASPDGSGGAIAHRSSGILTVRRSLFEGNTVRPFYSLGDEVGYGGGIFSFSAPLVVEDSVFRNNTASVGGGIIAWNEAKIVNCLFEDNTAQAREGTFQELAGLVAGSVLTRSKQEIFS